MFPIVVGVPHSANRSLCESLGHEHGHAGAKYPRWMHFIEHEELLESRDINAQIPIRDPLAVAQSWARRGKDIDTLLKSYECMFAFIQDRPWSIMLWHMEMRPRAAGLDDDDVDRTDPAYMIARVRSYQETVLKDVLLPNRGFYSQYAYRLKMPKQYAAPEG